MDAVVSVDEIDISDKQSLQLVLNFLHKYCPESFHLWQLLKNIQDDLLVKDHLWSYKLFVNDKQDIKCVLLIYWNVGSKDDLVTEEDKLKSRSISFFCDNKHDDLLISLIRQLIPWSKIETIVFAAIEHRFSLLIEKFIHENNLGKCHSSSFQRMDLDKQIYEEKTKKLVYAHRSDIVIRPLSVHDASIIDDLWTYKSRWSLAQIIFEIENFPAFGAYRNEELVSWSLTKYNGSIGTVFTKPEARGLGLATILNLYIASKLFEERKQERAYCYIAYDNIASFKTFEKLGYYRTYNIDWLICTTK